MIGNDIVDLQFLESPPCHHIQHLKRVCTQAEVCFVLDSPDPCKCLAMVWAAKEATYKLFAREGTLSHFIPRQFVLDVAGLVDLAPEFQCKVARKGMEAKVEIKVTERWAHATATFPECGVVRWSVREIKQGVLDGRQARIESEAVRLLAAELLAKCGERDVVLEFAGRIPTLRPKIGGRAGMGISLSHHGAFVGVAISWPVGETSLDGALLSGRFLEIFSRGKTCSTFTV